MTDAVLKILDRFAHDRPLPDPLPAEPMALFKVWFDEAVAAKKQANPNCMYLATATPDGTPSVRTVLCKGIDVNGGSIEFYTNYQSRKAAELESTWRASVLFHWDDRERQVRIEGPVVRCSAAESDAYFRTRHWQSRLGAWASDQSKPIASRAELLAKVGKVVAERIGFDVLKLLAGSDIHIERPPHWGGYRLWAEMVELWQGGTGRVHDRALWSRTLTTPVPASPQQPQVTAWDATRLQP